MTQICTSKKINLKTGDRIILEIPAVQPLATNRRGYSPRYPLRRRRVNYSQ